MIVLENKYLKVGISLLGAELEYVKFDDVNILWQRSELWNEQSPLLFPNIGQLKDGCFIYDGKSFNVLVHGFIKNSEFEVIKQEKDEVILRHKYNDKTLEIYPFKYLLDITYKLIDNTLSCRFKVSNLDNKVMYYALGFHPGYSYNGLDNLLGKYKMLIGPNDYRAINFDGPFVKDYKIETLKIVKKEELTQKLIIPRTLCYKDLDELSFESNKGKIIIKHNFDLTAFWQKKPEDKPQFICVEAWDGTPDSIYSGPEIETKDNLFKLNKASSIEKYYNISYQKN